MRKNNSEIVLEAWSSIENVLSHYKGKRLTVFTDSGAVFYGKVIDTTMYIICLEDIGENTFICKDRIVGVKIND